MFHCKYILQKLSDLQCNGGGDHKNTTTMYLYAKITA